MTLVLWSPNTGETAEVHKLGITEDGRAIYQQVPSYDLMRTIPGVEGDYSEVEYDLDEDGNYVVAK